MVANGLERSACNAESRLTYGFEPRPRQLLCRGLEQILRTQLLCNNYYCICIAETCKCTSELKCKKGDITAQFYCVVLSVKWQNTCTVWNERTFYLEHIFLVERWIGGKTLDIRVIDCVEIG